MHPATLPDDVLLAQCEVLRSRGGGPGGRHRNSTESRIVLRHRATGTEGQAGERRDQHENLAVATWRLRVALATTVRCEPGPAPSELWRSRTRGGRIACNPEHHDFPALLAEALDTVAAHGWDARTAAGSLGVSMTQLVRFAAVHRPALDAINARRAERGEGPLRA